VETLIDALYAYAQEKRVLGHLQTVEYRRAVGDIEKEWKVFRAALTGEQDQKLNVLLSQEREISLLEDEAILLAGITIGLDLGRL